MKFFNPSKLSFGFSLVELLVVISIISVLSAIVYANLSSARASARDSIRKADLKDLQLALELYKAQNGEYPDACTDSDTGWRGNVSGSYNCTSGQYIADLVPSFIPALPVDPTSTSNAANTGYLYRVLKSGGKNIEYKLMAYATVEKSLITSYNDTFARCPLTVVPTAGCPTAVSGTVSKTYAVYKGSTAQGW